MKKIISNINKIKGLIAPSLLLLALTTQGFAETDKRIDSNELNRTISAWYGGVGFVTAKAKCPTGCEDITYGLLGRVGYDFNSYFGLEGRLLKTMWKYEQQKIEHVGIFLKPMFPLSEKMTVYALLGFGKIETGDKIVFDDEGMAWGLGANYNLSEDNETKGGLGVFLDYERLLQKSDSPDFDTVSMGLSYNF